MPNDGEWEVMRRGWKPMSHGPDDVGLPEGHRFGYFLRRNIGDPKLNMVQAFCLCKWRDKDPLTNKPNWRRGGKGQAMYAYRQNHLAKLEGHMTFRQAAEQMQAMRYEHKSDNNPPRRYIETEVEELIARGDWIDGEF
jgi:hypothetical protein